MSNKTFHSRVSARFDPDMLLIDAVRDGIAATVVNKFVDIQPKTAELRADMVLMVSLAALCAADFFHLPVPEYMRPYATGNLRAGLAITVSDGVLKLGWILMRADREETLSLIHADTVAEAASRWKSKRDLIDRFMTQE